MSRLSFTDAPAVEKNLKCNMQSVNELLIDVSHKERLLYFNHQIHLVKGCPDLEFVSDIARAQNVELITL